MTGTPVQTPVLLLWFNRPDLARRVLDRLRAVQPARMFVAIDGPRATHPNDTALVAASTDLLNSIDWPCTVVTRINAVNQGCKQGVSAAVDWFFAQVPEGIVLEDDCLPDSTFFAYCADLLARYRHNERIMHISGANLYGGHVWSDDSYFFSPVPHVWGWASWQRAWQHYDVKMAGLTDFIRRGGIDKLVQNRYSVRYWKRGMQETVAGKLDSWDYQWVYAIWRQNGLCITPNRNLVSNIGYGPAATRTTAATTIADLPTSPLANIEHPTDVAIHEAAQHYAFATMYSMPPRLVRLLARSWRLIQRPGKF